MPIVAKLLVVYITLGFPSIERFKEFVAKAANIGVDYFEFGILPKYAKYDGPAIRRSYDYVRKLGIDTKEVLRSLKSILKDTGNVIALTYLEDYENNFEHLLKELVNAEISKLLLPDLLIDYVDLYKSYIEFAKKMGIDLTLFVSPSMPDKLIEEVSKESKPFLYYGIRPTTGVQIPVSPSILVKRIRSKVQSKLVIGFGLDENEISEVLNAGADGIAIGSAIINAIEIRVDEALKVISRVRGILDGHR